jgi:hypothetical protein
LSTNLDIDSHRFFFQFVENGLRGFWIHRITNLFTNTGKVRKVISRSKTSRRKAMKCIDIPMKFMPQSFHRMKYPPKQ